MEEVIKLASMGINLRSQALSPTVSIFPLLTLPLCLEPPPEFTLWPALGHSQSPNPQNGNIQKPAASWRAGGGKMWDKERRDI